MIDLIEGEGCLGCIKKDRKLVYLEERIESLAKDLHEEKKRTCVLSEALWSIEEQARKLKTYPCTPEDYEANKEVLKKYTGASS